MGKLATTLIMCIAGCIAEIDLRQGARQKQIATAYLKIIMHSKKTQLELALKRNSNDFSVSGKITNILNEKIY